MTTQQPIQDTSSQDKPRRQTTWQRQRRWVSAIAIGLSLTALVGWFSRSGSAVEQVIDRHQVQIAKVQRGDFQRDLQVQGQVVAANAPTLISQQDGLVRFIKLPGEAVRQGELLAVVESPSLENEVKQQQALYLAMVSEHARAELLAREQQLDMQQELNTAKVNLQAANREQQRASAALKQGVLRQLDWDVANDLRQQRQFEYEHAKQKVALAADKLSFERTAGEQAVARQALVVDELTRKLAALQIKAPVDGQVGNWLAPQQSQVQAGQAVLSVIDLSVYEAQLQIPESYAKDLVPGLSVALHINGQVVAGTLSHVSAEVKDAQVSARVKFSQQDAKALRQHQRLSAQIIFEQRVNVLKIARGDFISHGGRYVYRVKQGIAERIPVQLGALSVQWVEVVAGVEAGDEIVISQQSLFKDAQRVRLTD